MKMFVSASKLFKFNKKKKMEKMKPEIWGRLPIELYLKIKDILLEDIKQSFLKRPCVKIRIRLDLFNYVSFYFGLY